MSSPNHDTSFNSQRLSWLEFELGQELEMIEEGSTPDEVVRGRNFLAAVMRGNQEFREQVGNGILARYGVEEHDQLPATGIIEYAEAHMRWIEGGNIDE